MTQTAPFTTLAIPLPWRTITPLHRKFGARSMRFYYPGGNGLPIAGTAIGELNFRFDASQAMDRIIGMTFSIASAASGSGSVFNIQELNTGWGFSYNYLQPGGVFLQANVETMPDEVNLQWTFSAALTQNVYLSFFNFEVAPFSLV